jgi:hypothetical protein
MAPTILAKLRVWGGCGEGWVGCVVKALGPLGPPEEGIERKKANLVAGMKWLLGTYSNRYNRRHRRFGHVFAGRYKALVVDGSGNGYLRTVR